VKKPRTDSNDTSSKKDKKDDEDDIDNLFGEEKKDEDNIDDLFGGGDGDNADKPAEVPIPITFRRYVNLTSYYRAEISKKETRWTWRRSQTTRPSSSSSASTSGVSTPIRTGFTTHFPLFPFLLIRYYSVHPLVFKFENDRVTFIEVPNRCEIKPPVEKFPIKSGKAIVKQVSPIIAIIFV